jgi:hypothetical protein
MYNHGYTMTSAVDSKPAKKKKKKKRALGLPSSLIIAPLYRDCQGE